MYMYSVLVVSVSKARFYVCELVDVVLFGMRKAVSCNVEMFESAESFTSSRD